MKVAKPIQFIAAVLIFINCLFAATPGTFRGRIVESPDSESRWIFVQSANQKIRRVDVSSARVKSALGPERKEALTPGAEIRVTASQENGEWKASEIEILRGSPK